MKAFGGDQQAKKPIGRCQKWRLADALERDSLITLGALKHNSTVSLLLPSVAGFTTDPTRCSGGRYPLFTIFWQASNAEIVLNRFGFHNASSIDSLLDKDDVALEAILDEDDLLQECKAQNTRLIDYFQRVDVLQRLLAYVTGQIEGEDKVRFK